MTYNPVVMVFIALALSAVIVYVMMRRRMDKDIADVLLLKWCENAVNEDPRKRPPYLPKIALKSTRAALKKMGYSSALVMDSNNKLTHIYIATADVSVQIPIKDMRSEKM